MFCTKCGKELYEGDRFCAYCGAEVRAQRHSKNDEIVFNPPFKIEAQKKTEEILKAAEERKDTEKEKKETVSFDWNLDGFPATQPKKTEDVDFNWDSVLERRNRGFAPTEPTVEKIEPKIEPKAEAFEHRKAEKTEFVRPPEENIQPEAVLSTEELERELFGDFEKIKTESEKKTTDNSDARFYTFNQKNDAFQELLDKEKERVRSMEDEYNRQFAEMDYTWVPEVFPSRRKKEQEGEAELSFPAVNKIEEKEAEQSKEDKEETSRAEAVKIKEVPPVTDVKEAFDITDITEREDEPKVAIESEKAQNYVIAVQQPKTPNIVDLTGAAEEKTENAEKKEESPSNDKLRYSDIFPRVGTGGDENRNRNSGNGSSSLTVSADEVQEEKPVKKHILIRIIIALLVIALVIEGALLAIKFIAPDSQLSQKVNDVIFKIADIFTGGSQTSTQGSGEDINPNYGAKDAYLSGIILEKSAGVQSIGTVIYNPELVYDKDKTYAFDEISSAEDFVDAEWEEASATYGEKLMESLINYYDGWKATNTDKSLVGINTLEIGSIKTGEEGFYVLCKVIYAGTDGDEITQYQSVYAKISNGLMVINEIKEETL